MKTDQNYIKEAVRLAPDIGWVNDNGSVFFHGVPEKVINPNNCPKWFLAALAAQITEQVDATKYRVNTMPNCTSIFQDVVIDGHRDAVNCIKEAIGPDRTMNTIKVVVDSKVLVKLDRQKIQ